MNSMRSVVVVAGLVGGLTLAGAPLQAQDVDATPPLEIGALAPDFALPGATRYGLLQEQVKLSDYRGQTVVLAFFFRARTRG
jgi:homoserine kinase